MSPRADHAGLEPTEQALLLDDGLYDVHGTGERAVLVLELDLHELERHDDETLSGTRAGPSQDGELLRHLLLARKVQIGFAPEVVRRATGTVSVCRAEGGNGVGTYNLVARLGASSRRGGTSPVMQPTVMTPLLRSGGADEMVRELCVSAPVAHNNLHSFQQ